MIRRAPLALATAAAALLLACSDGASGGGGAAGTVENTSPACLDMQDNDGDGYTDCEDQDCWDFVFCVDEAGDSGGAGSSTSDPDASDPASRVLDGGGDGPTEGDVGPAPDDAGGGDLPPDASEDVSFDAVIDPPGCGYGELTGKVCAPNEQVFVNEAAVTIDTLDCDGAPLHLEVESGLDGSFHMTGIPAGSQTVNVVKGSFSVSYGVNIVAGQVVDVSGAAYKQCFAANSAKIAVMQGSWDNIESLLGKLGLAYDRYTTNDIGEAGTVLELLADLELMGQYDIIFANCGASHGWVPIENPEVMPHVKAFIEAGGSFYMSDYAWVYGEWSFPDMIEFQKSDDVLDMYTDDSPQMLQSGLSIPATVVDGTLASWLGKTQLVIEIDNGPQIAPESTGPDAFGHVIGDVNQPFAGPDALSATIPLIISYVPGPGAGRVVYTNFHNDAQATDDMLAILDYLVFTL